MKNQLIILAAVAVAAALPQSLQAVPITGVIGFSGVANTDNSDAASSTEVVTWGVNNIGITSGTFASLSSSAMVALASPWFFNSGPKNDFWVVSDGANTYMFNLTYSYVFGTSATSASIFLAGTVVSSVMGLDPTAFTGAFTLQDPSSPNGKTFSYTESMSFGGASVPDGSSTILLLGGSLMGLGWLRRRTCGDVQPS